MSLYSFMLFQCSELLHQLFITTTHCSNYSGRLVSTSANLPHDHPNTWPIWIRCDKWQQHAELGGGLRSQKQWLPNKYMLQVFGINSRQPCFIPLLFKLFSHNSSIVCFSHKLVFAHVATLLCFPSVTATVTPHFVCFSISATSI